MRPSCVFCRIVKGEEEARIVYQDEAVTAFHDHAPEAPTHIVIIPNRHVRSLKDTDDDDTMMLGKLVATAREIAQDLGLDKDGYRLVVNTGSSAGQSVPHLHLHLLGGRQMRWPSG